MAVTTFQFGVGGYEGEQDTVIFSLDRDSNFGTEGHISADQQDFNSVRQGLLKFDDIFGDQPGQIPYGATINSAQLKVFVQDSSNASMQMSLYRMLTDWDESTATWNFFGGTTGGIGGVQASEGESSNLPPDAVLFDSKITPNSATAGIFDVTKSLEYWAAGAPNYGWLVESAATNGWDFRTNNSNHADRPVLDDQLQHARRDGRLPNLEYVSVTPGRREHRDANREGRSRSIGQYFRGHEHQLHGHRGRRQPGRRGRFRGGRHAANAELCGQPGVRPRSK